MVIDSHQHFWNYDPSKHTWMSDEMEVIKKDFTPEMLSEIFQQQEIDGCVAVQADQSEGETDFLVSLASQNSFIKGVVGWVDLRASNLGDRLAHFKKFPVIKGFRHVVQDEPDPNFMLGKAFQNGIELLGQYDFTYDILIFPNQLPAAISLSKTFPEQPFVLDHIAKPLIKERKLEEWESHIRELAASPNVSCKVSGMVTEADWSQWEYEHFVPYLEVIFDAFGVDRIMYGSDWPVCLLAAEYEKMKAIIDQFISGFDEAQKKAIMGGNAERFYKLTS
ncbi:MAG: amidohydrolase family protein [Bacteroidota bacterium]